MQLTVGNIAPDFSLPDQNDTTHTLKQYRGKWVLLYFYPKDDTPGCTIEACEIRDNFDMLTKHLIVLGASADSVTSHKKFEEKYSLPFTLLADPGKSLLNAYGTDGLLFAKRTSFLIDPEGKIAKIYENVKPNIHAKEIITDIISLTT